MPKPSDEIKLLTSLWSERAKTYGKRCVLDLQVPESAYDMMTANQWRFFEPILKERMNGLERRILDYGCGAGRFTPLLMQLFPKASVVGYDPCPELIAMAPGGASYISGDPEQFFSAFRRFDVIFIALVLGGLPDSVLGPLATMLINSLNEDGLILFAEHTHPTERGNDFWHWRPEAVYRYLFAPLSPTKVGEYTTFGNTVSIFVGRKPIQ